jgi:hypothetical protein
MSPWFEWAFKYDYIEFNLNYPLFLPQLLFLFFLTDPRNRKRRLYHEMLCGVLECQFLPEQPLNSTKLLHLMWTIVGYIYSVRNWDTGTEMGCMKDGLPHRRRFQTF